MLHLRFLIKYYMLSFLFIDSLSGFVRIYLGIENPLFNIGYWVRGPLLLMLFFFFVIKFFKKEILFDEVLTLLMFIYFLFNAFFHLFDNSSVKMFVNNLTYILRFQFLLFLYVFLKNHMHLDNILTKRIIKYNFLFFVVNLSVGYFFGFGLESYRFAGTSKGMFQGGNPVSILNLIFFTFFLLDGKLRKKIIPVAFCFFNAFIIASKSVFGFLVPMIFALKRRSKNLNKIIAYNFMIILIFISFTPILKKASDLYESRFGLNIEKSISAAEKVGGLYNNQILNSISSINFRRYASLNIQLEESFSNSKVFLFGTSFSGQNLFWNKRGEFWFTNASMDFFDLFFKFGLIGTIIFFSIFNRVSIKSIFKANDREKIAILLFLAYSFFGGHVIDSVTSGSLFYYLLASLKS